MTTSQNIHLDYDKLRIEVAFYKNRANTLKEFLSACFENLDTRIHLTDASSKIADILGLAMKTDEAMLKIMEEAFKKLDEPESLSGGYDHSGDPNL